MNNLRNQFVLACKSWIAVTHAQIVNDSCTMCKAEKGADAHSAGSALAISSVQDQADTKLSDFSRPARTMVTSCWSVIGLPKM